MYQFVIDKKSGQLRKGPLLVFATMILLIFITVLTLDRKNTAELTKITQSSIEVQLIAVAQSASTLIDMDAYMEYTSLEAVQADRAAYQQMRRALSALGSSVGAKYIYVLREIDGVYYFIFDTDTEVDTTLLPYEISAVHEQAFAGAWAAGIMNVKDEYGSFNTGAVPIYYAGEIAGIVCVDYEDRFFSESIQTAKQNKIVLVTTLLLVLATLTLFLLQVLRRLAGCAAEHAPSGAKRCAHGAAQSGVSL
jgi:Signal transduction histidine kinase regulating citrate/malate metabolism